MNGFVPDHAGAAVRPSPNSGERRDGKIPGLVILHYTGMASGAAAEDWLADPASQVSAHYLVHEDGHIVQMVRECDRAWHAGKSAWGGETDINSVSIGIEIVNPGHQLGYRRFPRRQIDAVVALCAGIKARYGIQPHGFLAHSDVAPGRKVDPGEWFPWGRLAREGLARHWSVSRARAGGALGEGEAGEPVR
ncbi:MAG: N-acetylmuramoyl-L-alanine amidase, partial [Rhizobiaceae bacterium]